MGPFSLGDGTLDSDMINLAIVIYALPFDLEVCV
jgi:hypothetical protein